VKSLINGASTEGFIEKTKEGYQFTHDKLQALFQSLVERSEKNKLHYLIGSQYVSYSQDEDHTCHAAVHLNSGGNYTREREHGIKLACIYLDAAKRSRAKSAFENAAAFLRLGLRVLDEEGHGEKWTRHFELALEMTEALAKLELIVGNLAACRQMNQEVLRRCNSAEMKINALVTEVDARMVGNEVDQTIIASMRALHELCIPMPLRVSKFKLLLKLRKIRFLLGSMSDDALLDPTTCARHQIRNGYQTVG
jgi:predicted ATPase